MKIIIVEGIDRVGKTTLVNKLIDELGYVKFCSLERYDKINSTDYSLTKQIESEKVYAIVSTLKSMQDADVNLVIDRLHISEYVYGMKERGYVNADMVAIDAILSELNTTLILVNPTNISKSNKEHGKCLDEHQKEFEKFAYNSKIRDLYVCNYNSLNDIVECIKAREA